MARDLRVRTFQYGGKARISITMSEKLLERLDGYCSLVGITRSAAIGLAIVRQLDCEPKAWIPLEHPTKETVKVLTELRQLREDGGMRTEVSE